MPCDHAFNVCCDEYHAHTDRCFEPGDLCVYCGIRFDEY
jgi:hypothetical protein